MSSYFCALPKDYIKCFGTSHNRTVYASPPVGGSASIRLGQSLRSIPTLTPDTFLRLLETYGFPYRNRKNVIYSRNVMRNGAQTFVKIIKNMVDKEKNIVYAGKS